jgi:hypothetical protein
MNRRGVLAALLCSPLCDSLVKAEGGMVVVNLAPQKTEDVVLKVQYAGESVSFTAPELIAALRPWKADSSRTEPLIPLSSKNQ